MFLTKEKIMLRGLYRGTLDILYDGYNNARIKMNTHIRSFDQTTQDNTYIKDSIIGFWRMIFEILLNLYLVFTLSVVTFLILCTVVLAWPIKFFIVTFTAITPKLSDEYMIQQQVAAELADREKNNQATVTDKPKK